MWNFYGECKGYRERARRRFARCNNAARSSLVRSSSSATSAARSSRSVAPPRNLAGGQKPVQRPGLPLQGPFDPPQRVGPRWVLRPFDGRHERQAHPRCALHVGLAQAKLLAALADETAKGG